MYSLQGLTLQEVNTIIVGLMKLPAETSFELILKVKSQGDAQFAELNKAEDEAKED